MCTPSIWPQNSYLWGVNFLKYFSASALIKTFWGPKFVLVLIYWSPKCPISFSCHFLRFIDVMGFHMNYPVGSLYTLLSPHTFFHESSIWGNPGLGGIRMFGQRPKKVLLTSPAPTITKQIWPPRSHLITMLPGKMVYCGRLPSQKLGVPGNISGEIFKRNYQCSVRSSGSIQHIWLLWTSMIVQWSFQAPNKSFCEDA